MIILITPTGGRPKQFELCQRWMVNQTYTEKVLWIIVDDCYPFTTAIKHEFPDNWAVVHKYPEPLWKRGDNTQSRNLKVGIDIVKKIPEDQVDVIFIIEDDDYYSPVYLEKMVKKLEGFDAVGEKCTIYYHTKLKKFNVSTNEKHTSLFQLAFKPKLIPNFESCYGNKFIDMIFCKSVKNINLFSKENLAIGMKGQEGREGIGLGHRGNIYRDSDKSLNKLKELVGNDYIYYE